MLVTSLYASRSEDALTRAAGDTICRELRMSIEGGKPSDDDFRQVTRLGGLLAEQGWSAIEGVRSGEILMPYKNEV